MDEHQRPDQPEAAAAPTSAAESYVTKEFLIEIITRDIGITDAILELVDNSLDRAVELYHIDVTKVLASNEPVIPNLPIDEPLTVKIDISPQQVLIQDNTGGISRQDLEKEVFVFGTNRDEHTYRGLSAFGVGMKRALFKLGRQVELRTITVEEESAVSWNVTDWMNKPDEDWFIPFLDPTQSSIEYTFQAPGTVIKVDLLNEQVHKRFSQSQFLLPFKDKLRTTYALFLKAGFRIIVNDEELTHSLPVFFTSDEITYTNQNFQVEDVSVNLLAGVTPVEDRKPRGWYVFCNGRMVLEANKDTRTGWGDNAMAGFHPKFNHFLGYVSFTSDNVRALPWSTTKQDVEKDSPVYVRALEEMYLQSRPIMDFLDRWRSDNSDEDTSSELSDLLRDGQPTPIFSGPKEERTFKSPPTKEKLTTVTITFKAKADQVAKVKQSFGDSKMSNASLGALLFDYYFMNEVG